MGFYMQQLNLVTSVLKDMATILIASERVGKTGRVSKTSSIVISALIISAAWGATMWTPTIFFSSPSTTILITPLVSLIMCAFGTSENSTVLQIHFPPEATTSASVDPTPATEGLVNTA